MIYRIIVNFFFLKSLHCRVCIANETKRKMSFYMLCAFFHKFYKYLHNTKARSQNFTRFFRPPFVKINSIMVLKNHALNTSSIVPNSSVNFCFTNAIITRRENFLVFAGFALRWENFIYTSNNLYQLLSRIKWYNVKC